MKKLTLLYFSFIVCLYCTLEAAIFCQATKNPTKNPFPTREERKKQIEALRRLRKEKPTITRQPSTGQKTKREARKEQIKALRELRYPTQKPTTTTAEEQWVLSHLQPITKDFEHSAPATTQKELNDRRLFSMPKNVLVISKNPKDKDYYQFIRTIKNLIKSFIDDLTKELEFTDQKNKDYIKTTDFDKTDLSKNILAKIDSSHTFLDKKLKDIVKIQNPSRDVTTTKDGIEKTLTELKTFSETYFNHTPGAKKP